MKDCGLDVPPGVVTVTLTAPAACGGVENVSDDADVTVTDAAGIVVPPIVTEVLLAEKPVPVNVTVVPPAIGPASGTIAVNVGTPKYVNVCGALVPFGVVTVTSTAPSAWGGVSTVIDVALFTTRFVPLHRRSPRLLPR